MKKLILSLLLVCSLFVEGYCGLTKAQITNEVRRLVQDSNGTSRERWTDLQISTFIDMAQDEIFALTWCLEASTSIFSITDTTACVLPSDLFAVTNVYYDGKVLPEISLSKLDNVDENWHTASTGTPTYYYITRTSVTWINFYLCPSSSKSVDINYIQIPQKLVNDNDRPFNRNDKLSAFDYLIVLWIAHYCCLQEGKFDRATQFYNLYSIRIKDMRDSFNLKPNYNPNISGG